VIAAILRAQWLSMRSFRLGSRRRGAIFSIATALIWYGFWTLLAYLAEEFTATPEAQELLHTALPAGLMFVFLYWQLAPIVSASLGASLDLKKLLIYPVPHRKLFVIEVLLRLTTCAEMMLVLAGSMTGLLRNPAYGGIRAAPRIIAPFLIFVFFNLLLSAGMRNLLERLLTHKRVREILMLVLVISAAIPQIYIASRTPMGAVRHLLTEAPGGFWPWTAVTRVALRQESFYSSLILVWWSVAALAFGRRQFERSLHYDAQATASPTAGLNGRTRSRLEAFYRLPALFLPDPLAAIVEKELRSLSRTPRFRMVFIMGFSFGLLVWLPITFSGHGRGQGSSVVSDHYLTIVSVYALALLGQVSYLNTFGFDRSAAQIYFSLPMSVGKALVGKNIAAVLFILVEMLAVTLASIVLRIGIGPGKLAEAFVVTAIVAVYLLAIGNMASVHFPRAMNPERVSQGGAASRMQALIFVFYPIALLPVFLAFWAEYVFHSQLIFALIMCFAAILGTVVYWIALESAVGAAVQRREKMLMELSRSEGPVATE
jgi:ABC-2 type transport system permease protein